VTARRFEFEGEQLTLREIRARVPALSESNVRTLLRKGMRTRAAMLAYDPATWRREAGIRGRAAAEAGGFNDTMHLNRASLRRARESGFIPRVRTAKRTRNDTP
jgi:hypothetical protein